MVFEKTVWCLKFKKYILYIYISINSYTSFCWLFRVPEEKQMMFLPGILEEEEESKNTPTPRTSTASLAHPPTDSPANERR